MCGKMQGMRTWLLLMLGWMAALLIVGQGVQRATALPSVPPDPQRRLDASLRSLPSQDQAAAQALGVWAGPNALRVIVEGTPHASFPFFVQVEAQDGSWYQVRIPRDALPQLATWPGVQRVRPPLPHAPSLVFSEGLAAGGFFPWINSGWNGRGVHIAIIDLGFANWQALSNQGELPSFVSIQNFRADGQFEATPHGSAVAEIVYDAAPGATLSLYAINTELELNQAVNAAIQQGVDVIVHALSWFNTGPGDGSGYLGDITRQAEQAGILWVNAAGNQARRYYAGTFTPSPNHPSRHIFADNDEGNDVALQQGQTVCGFLSWDAWPTTDDDYDLYLYRVRDAQWVARSDNVQDGTQAPVEALCYTATTTDTYAFVITHYSQNKPPRFLRLFTDGADLQYTTPTGSIVQPADAASVLAVGAVFWQANYPLEPFSSLGPTTDGRIKPDLVAYDGVSTVTYGLSDGLGFDQGGQGFFGTSASAPLVGGAAALVRQRYPDWTPAHVRDFLKNWSIDQGIAGPDNQFGHGRLYLPPSQPTVTPTIAVTVNAPISAQSESTLGDISCTISAVGMIILA